MRLRLRAGLALAVLIGAAACEPSSASPAPQPAPSLASPSASPSPTAQPATFRYGLREPSSLLPAHATTRDELVVIDTLFDSLTAYDREGRVVGAAAVAWEPDAEGRVWTFRLRPGAAFATPARDPVTSGDFVFAWNLAVAEGRPGAYHLDEVEGYAAVRDGAADTLSGLSAPDPETLVVTLSEPFADFPAVAAHPALGPLPRALYEADPAAFAAQPAGNGPFVAAAWERGSFLRVTRFAGWRNGRPAPLTEVLFRFSDAETAYVAFQQERYDYAPLPAGALAVAREEFGSAAGGYAGPGVLDGPDGQLYFLGANHTIPPFDRLEVRQALSLAIDRQALARAVREGNADPAYSAVPRAVPGSRPRPCAACRHDPAMARRLFRAAGVTELELWINRDGGHERVAELIGAQLQEAGVTLRIRTPPEPEPGTSAFALYLDRLRSGEAGLFRFGWTVEHQTLDDALTPLFSASLAGVDGAANYGRYTAPDVTALLQQARATLDEDERRGLYWRAEDIALNRDQAVIPLLTFRHAAVVSDRFEGFSLSPLGLPNLAEVRPVTLPPEDE